MGKLCQISCQSFYCVSKLLVVEWNQESSFAFRNTDEDDDVRSRERCDFPEAYLINYFKVEFRKDKILELSMA